MAARIRTYEGGLVLCTGYVLETDQGLIAIDAPAGMSKWIAKNFPDQQVTDLLITHMHFDHIEDAGMMQESYGCRIHAYAPYDDQLSLIDLANSTWGMNLQIDPFEVNDVLGSTTSHADWGGLAWQLYHIPGHSPDSMVYHLPEQGCLFSGDVLFAGNIGRTDFQGGNHDALISGIQNKLFVLNAHTIVYPGHGPSTSIGEECISNPYAN